MQPEAAPAPVVHWQPVPSTAAAPLNPSTFVPIPKSADAGAMPVVWTPLPQDSGGTPPAHPRWTVLEPGQEPPLIPPSATGAPLTAEEAEDRRKQLPPPPDSYVPLLRLGQLPVAAFLSDGGGQLSFQQVSPSSGGVAGGTGNQNYGLRADLAINNQWLLSGFYTYADDPLFARISVRPTQPENLWTVAGVAVRGQLAGGKAWAMAIEASAELFSVGSGGCFSNGCSTTSDNIFNPSGQRVLTRNGIGSLSLPLSWRPLPRWQLSLVPAVSWLPATQGAGQGGSGSFYGTNISIGAGSTYRIGNQLNLFSSVMVPLGPGNNGFDAQLSFQRVPIVSVGANYAVNPRISLEAAVTNGYGLSPATAILALPSAPTEPMLSGRFVWTPTGLDSPKVRFSPRQRSLALGGVSVSTALLPHDGTTQLWVNADSLGNVLASAAYSASNDFQFEISGGTYGDADAVATGVAPGSDAANFLNTYLGPGNRNVRFGGKAMVLRPTKGLPIWASGRITVGRNFDTNSFQGYLFFETVNTWEATPWLAFNLNPKLAWSGLGTPWGVGLSANIQLGQSFQLIPELNAVATSFGGPNGTNGTLALRWLASSTTAVDLFASNASGILDMGQLLGTGEVRIGAKVTVQF